MIRALLCLLCCTFAFSAAAGISVKNGEISIDVSGGDGGYGGGRGGDSGDVNLNLSYADAAKTQVMIGGMMIIGGKSTPISQVLPVAQIKHITVTAIGGDGGAGYDGTNGYDGQDGMNGYDGCPPGNGYNGGNGGDGTDGGPGGNGGRGGIIHVNVPGDQSEILMLVSIGSAPGRGGSGGNGGRGGSGGRGGYGGRNTCVDAKGNPTGGPDGVNGSNGYSGRNGSDGRSGVGGMPGSQSYDVNDNGVVHSYPRPFQLSVTGVKTLDDNEDGVFEPGENLHVMQLQVTNTGPMPTPTGQILKLAFQNSSTLVVKTQPASLGINQVMAGNSTQTLTFPKGALVLQGVDDPKLIGKKSAYSSSLAINSFSLPFAGDGGFVFHWPIGVGANAASERQYFGSAQTVNFTLHNISTKDVGPNTSQPAETTFSWSSTGIPGADVTVTLADGRKFTLDKPQQFNDFVLKAKGNTPLPLSVNIANSKNAYTGTGKLIVTLKVKDFSSGADDQVDFAQTSVFVAIDLRPVAVNRHITLSKTMTCIFPNMSENTNQEADVSAVDLVKAKNSDKFAAYYYKWSQKSPAYIIDAFDFAIYTDLVAKSDDKLVIAFMNDLFTAATKGGDGFWYFSGCYLR